MLRLLGNHAIVNDHGAPTLLGTNSGTAKQNSAPTAKRSAPIISQTGLRFNPKISEMSHRLRMSTISSSEKRNDLHLTTTGVGHAFQSPISFPPEDFKVRLQ